MKVRTLDNMVIPEPTCADCQYIYQKDIGTRLVWKCRKKPRGWGYDIVRSHVACFRYKPKKGDRWVYGHDRDEDEKGSS